MSELEAIINSSFMGFEHWGYLAIFLSAVLEGIPIIGLFAPGIIIAAAGGFLVTLGLVNIYCVIIAAALGAIVGDFFGYSLGRKYGMPFLERYGKYFFLKPATFEKIRTVMDGHTGKSLIIGRFNSLTRAFAPFIAGASKVAFIKFISFNVAGGFMWATTFVLVGYVFGQSFAGASKYIGGIMTVTIILCIALFYLYRCTENRESVFYKFSSFVFKSKNKNKLNHQLDDTK